MSKANARAEVMKVLKGFDLDSSAVWDCHGTPVILQKAIETVAVKAGITFEPPAVIEADSAKKTAVVCVTGVMGDRKEWSLGEACPANNKNAYPFAMAEKRAKDRVVLKLINIHGLAYSEDEADDFKNANPARKDLGPTDKANDGLGRGQSAHAARKSGVWEALIEDMRAVDDVALLREWFKSTKTTYEYKNLPEGWRVDLDDEVKNHAETLKAIEVTAS